MNPQRHVYAPTAHTYRGERGRYASAIRGALGIYRAAARAAARDARQLRTVVAHPVSIDGRRTLGGRHVTEADR